MAGLFRQNTLTSYLLTLLSCLLLLLTHVNNVCASPVAKDPPPVNDVDLAAHYWKRVTPIVVSSEVGDNVSVVKPTTDQVIPQGPGTDGGGTNFSLTAIIWLAFVFVIGIPLALAGIRLWRFTTGMGIGLAVAICLWAAFVNTVSSDGLSDIVLTVIPVGGFVVGFVFGMLDFGRWAGILLIGVLGGLSVGIRVVLLRPGLLIHTYLVNWLVLALFMIMGLSLILSRQHVGISGCCAAIGTFLIGLGIDLIIEKQDGMSFALRFLLDRNNSHFLAVVHKGYNPSMMTQIILGATLGATPVLAFAQHKIFKAPFRPERSQTDADMASLMETESGIGAPEKPARVSRMQLLKSRFSMA
ncbi:hypothetical protein BD311DRAFT_804847 [Dichomitus squalens]|uniref:TM7S3/TM198-like domain-containing protein n=1 Tax=Dichomitus squalens TaxID=114155 RepID=A0A4V2K118_9APHY|nr:hypothetical protein BD311DRAFT_804847 [Dichomitus squalens]